VFFWLVSSYLYLQELVISAEDCMNSFSQTYILEGILLSLWIKWPGHEADHSPLSSTEVLNLVLFEIFVKCVSSSRHFMSVLAGKK
jgi:hypothetical protein